MRFLPALLLLQFAASAGFAQEETAPIPASASEQIRALEGKPARVAGTITRVGKTSSGSIYFLNFDRDDFTGIVRGQNVEALEKALGGSLEETLVDKAVTLSGTISLHRAKPQIEISDAAQIGLPGGATAPMPAGPKGSGDTPPAPKPATPVLPAANAVAEPEILFKARDDRKMEREIESEDVHWVGVVGEVEEIKTLATLKVIQFERADFSAVVFTRDEVKVAAGLGEEAKGSLEFLKGKEIQVVGYLEEYNGKPQIKIKEVGHIKILERE